MVWVNAVNPCKRLSHAQTVSLLLSSSWFLITYLAMSFCVWANLHTCTSHALLGAPNMPPGAPVCVPRAACKYKVHRAVRLSWLWVTLTAQPSSIHCISRQFEELKLFSCCFLALLAQQKWLASELFSRHPTLTIIYNQDVHYRSIFTINTGCWHNAKRGS